MCGYNPENFASRLSETRQLIWQNMRPSTAIFTKLVGMWDSPDWNSDGTWDGQGSGHNFEGNVSRASFFSDSCALPVAAECGPLCAVGVASLPLFRRKR